MPGAPLRSVPTGTDVSAAGSTDHPTDSPTGPDVRIAADTLDVDLEPLGAAVVTTAVLSASLIDFLR